MKKIVVTVLAVVASLLTAQSHFPYRPAASADGAFAVYANPSLLGAEKGFNLLASVKHDYVKDGDDAINWNNGEYFGAAVNFGGFGFYLKRDPEGSKTNKEYGISLGGEMSAGVYGGTTFRWFSADNRKSEADFFLTVRPYTFLSITGGVTNISNNRNVVNSLYSLAYRPFSEKLTVAAESRVNGDNFEKMDYNLSLNAEAWPGINLIASYGDNLDKSDAVLGLGLNMTLGKLQLGSYSASNDDFKNAQSSSYMQISSEAGKMLFTNPASKIVKIKLAGNYKEELSNNNLFGMLNIKEEGKTSRELMENIRKLKADPEVAGIVFDCDSYTMSYASREELRSTLEDFKSSGKKIVSYFTGSTQNNYFLISLSDKIAMHPQGMLELPGTGIEMTFFKKILDKFGIEMQATRHGKYKSAVEQFTLEKASPANREQFEAILKSIDKMVKGKIAASRGFSVEDLNKMMNATPYFTSEDALSSKLVDEVFYPDLLDEKAAKFIKDKAAVVDGDTYLNEKHKNYSWQGFSGDKVAVVYATGEIRTGESSSASLFSGDVMGDVTVSKMIKSAASDEDVKAIVIRVDSPGGSGLASDNILREIRLAKEKKKTIIVSMGGLAASGGYYISCFADKIYTDETTFTGSIGVFGMSPNLDSLYKNLGITHDRITLNKYAGTGSGYFGMHKQTPDEAALMQGYIDKFYNSFIGLVSEGRKMTKEQVDQVAQGRVWTGADAIKIGLADEIGGLKEAIAEARKAAKIDVALPDAEVLNYYTKNGKFNPMSMLNGVAMSLLPAKLQQTSQILGTLNGFSENNDNLLLMPVNMEIK